MQIQNVAQGDILGVGLVKKQTKPTTTTIYGHELGVSQSLTLRCESGWSLTMIYKFFWYKLPVSQNPTTKYALELILMLKKKSSPKTAIQPWRFMSCEFTVPPHSQGTYFLQNSNNKSLFSAVSPIASAVPGPTYAATPLLSERKSKVLTPEIWGSRVTSQCC